MSRVYDVTIEDTDGSDRRTVRISGNTRHSAERWARLKWARETGRDTFHSRLIATEFVPKDKRDV